MKQIGEKEMVDNVELMFYGASLIIGVASGILGVFHRGGSTYDKERAVNLSKGDGLSAKILKHYPNYAKISPAVDHVFAGIGMPAILTPAVGVAVHCLSESIETNLTSEHCALLAVQGSTLLYILAEARWEICTCLKKKKIDLGDKLQWAVDFSVPLAFYYTMENIINRIF